MAASLASIALSLVLTGQATTAPTDLATLVARLAAEDPDARDAAQQAILALPGDPTDALRDARNVAVDPDARMRLDALLVQARERAEMGASRITLQFDDAPLNRVVAAIERQAHARFNDLGPEFGANELPRVTIDVRDVSFWEAIARVQKAANVVFLPGGSPDGGWRVMRNFGQPGAATARGGVESGAFCFLPVLATYNRTVGYARNPGGGGGGGGPAADREQFSVQVQMLAEPKVRLGEQAQVVLDRARDTAGNDLLPAAGAAAPANLGGRGIVVPASQGQALWDLPLRYPKRPGERIAELSGVVRVAVANRTVTIETDDLFGGAGRIERTLEGARLTIDPVPPAAAAGQPPNAPPADGRVEVTFALDRAVGSPLANQFQRALRRARLADPAGRPMQQVGFDQVDADGRRVEFRVTFARTAPQQEATSGGTYKFRLDVPVGFRPVEVPFTLRDLKMP